MTLKTFEKGSFVYCLNPLKISKARKTFVTSNLHFTSTTFNEQIRIQIPRLNEWMKPTSVITQKNIEAQKKHRITIKSCVVPEWIF